jgi:hypothetical protein
MANRFYRRPEVGSDENSWGQYNDAHILEAIGECNVKLYDDAGVLKVTKGRIGISDGTHEGVCIIDTVTTISLVPVTNNNWAEIYMTVSGPNVTFTALDTDVGIDINWSELPPDFLAAYVPEKGGYYINSARRCIGLIKKDSGGNLESIINVRNNEEGYSGYSYYDNSENKKIVWNCHKDYGRSWADFEIGVWDMDADNSVDVTIPSIDVSRIFNISAVVFSDSGTSTYPSPTFENLADPRLIDMGVTRATTAGIDRITVARRTGGLFDSVDYDSAVINRGYVYFDLRI